MLADFVETQVPAILILNMMDVAKNQGISINTKLLSEKPGIPVVPMSAIQKKDYSLLYETIEHILVHPLFVSLICNVLVNVLCPWYHAGIQSYGRNRLSRPHFLPL